MNERQPSVFAALADPVRRDVLKDIAAKSPVTATQLAQQYPITRQGILKHLQILETAGLVEVKRRGREKRYTLMPQPLQEVGRWIEELNGVWDARLERLKTLLEQDNTEGTVVP